MDRLDSWTYKLERYLMSSQRLPRVKAELFPSIAADMKTETFEKWITKLATENPQLVMLVDAMGQAGAINVAAMVYHVLDSQAEADQLNEDFS